MTAIVKFANVAHLVADTSRLRVIPRLPAAVAGAGLEGMALDAADSFEELISDLAKRGAEAFAVGFSVQRAHAMAFRLRPGEPPAPIASTFYAPEIPAWSAAAALTSAKRDGIMAHVFEVAERQRAIDPSAVGDPLLVTVGRDGLATRLLHLEQIGETTWRRSH